MLIAKRNTPTIWAIIDTDDKSTIEVDVYIIGTVKLFDASNKLYVGSCITEKRTLCLAYIYWLF